MAEKNASKGKKPQKQAKPKIELGMTIGDIVAKYPAAAEVLMDNGIHCIGCHVKHYETLGQGLAGHGLDDKQVAFVLKQVNEAIAGDEEPGEQGKDFIVTKRAAKKISELLSKSNKTGYGLRVSIVPGGCSGYSYGLEFEKAAQKQDKVLNENGIKVFIDPKSLTMVKGAKLDFVDTLQGGGFKITNPNAMDSCGCGQSFH